MARRGFKSNFFQKRIQRTQRENWTAIFANTFAQKLNMAVESHTRKNAYINNVQQMNKNAFQMRFKEKKRQFTSFQCKAAACYKRNNFKKMSRP